MLWRRLKPIHVMSSLVGLTIQVYETTELCHFGHVTPCPWAVLAIIFTSLLNHKTLLWVTIWSDFQYHSSRSNTTIWFPWIIWTFSHRHNYADHKQHKLYLWWYIKLIPKQFIGKLFLNRAIISPSLLPPGFWTQILHEE